MAITILLGPPGSGKSYEATAFHVVPALMAGRKVITNVALFPEEIARFISAEKERVEGSLAWRLGQAVRKMLGRELLPEIVEFDEDRLKIVTASAENPRPFSRRDDYGDKTLSERGEGPLYIIDEAQKCLPRVGTDTAVFFWFTEHRHEFADVVLMTQQARQISADIGGNAEIVYKMRKNTNLGSSKSYRRLKLDGWQRGSMVVETKLRRYDPRYFPLYRSHTKNSGGHEADNAGRSIFLKWPFLGLALCLVLFVRGCMGSGLNPLDAFSKGEARPAVVAAAAPKAPEIAPKQVVAPVVQIQKSHPYEGWRMSVAASMVLAGGRPDPVDVYVRLVGPDAQSRIVRASELEDDGYRVTVMDECTLRIVYPATSFFRDVRCAGHPVEDGKYVRPERDVPAFTASTAAPSAVAADVATMAAPQARAPAQQQTVPKSSVPLRR